MATAMQYEIIGRILERSDNNFDGDIEPAKMAAIAKSQTAMFEFIVHTGITESSVPLVDVTDAWRHFHRFERKDGALFHRFDFNYLKELERPWGGRPADRIPWPIALICAELFPGVQVLWVVRQAASSKPETLAFAYVLGEGKLSMVPLDGFPTLDPDDAGSGTPVEICNRITAALAAAKNAKWMESEPNRATRKRYPAVAGVRFRHIEIDMGKPKPMHKTADRYKTAETPWHHRRGHWAYYSPQKPLFGRAGEHGWYWRPYTEVGDKAHGEIVQDYSVRASLP